MPSGRRCSAASSRYRSPRASAMSTATSCCASRASSAHRIIYTEQRLLERIGSFADRAARARPRSSRCARAPSWWTSSSSSGRSGKPLPRAARTTSPSSSSPPARPASPRAWCSRTRNLLANIRGGRRGRPFHRRRRQPVVDAADPRHGPDRLSSDHARQSRPCPPDADRPVRAPAAAVAAAGRARPRDHSVLAELRLPPLPQGAGRARAGRARPVAACG